MERELISKKEQAKDMLLISLSGGVIGIISAVVEREILTQTNIVLDQAIIFAGTTLIGAGLFVNGAIKSVNLKKV